MLKNVPAIQEVLTPAIEQIATGKTPAKTVLDALEAKVQPLLKGRYPIPTTI